MLVFFCNHCSSTSPARALDYLRWRAEHEASDAAAAGGAAGGAAGKRPRPQQQQRVRVLAGGMGDLVRWASCEPGVDMDALFTTYEKTYTGGLW
jgi:hypothetical protein